MAQLASIAASGDRKRPIQLDDDEFVVIRLTGCAARAERIIVIVKHSEFSVAKGDNAFDRLKGKPKHSVSRPREIKWVSQVEQVGYFGFDEEAIGRQFIEIDKIDFLEAGRGTLEVVALNNKELVVCHLREVSDGLTGVRCCFHMIEPLSSCKLLRREIKFINDQTPLIRICR